MALGVGIENIALARLDVPMRWVWALFGGLFLASDVVCFANPTDTFAGLADTLGFLFLIVGLWCMVRAFLELALNPLWWTGLISGILMTALAFWSSGQFFIDTLRACPSRGIAHRLTMPGASQEHESAPLACQEQSCRLATGVSPCTERGSREHHERTLEDDVVRDNIRDNIHSVHCVLGVQIAGRIGRFGAIWTHRTLGLPG